MTAFSWPIGLLGAVCFLFAVGVSIREVRKRNPKPYCSNCGIIKIKRGKVFCKTCETAMERW